MLEKYKEWIDKARDYTIIDNRALILHGDSAEILSGSKVKADAVIMDPPYDFNSAGGKLFGREKAAFYDLRERGLDKGFDLNILDYAAAADSMIVFFHNDQLFSILQRLTQPRHDLFGADTPEDEDLNTTMALYDRYILGTWHKNNPMPVANKHYVPDTECYIHVWRKPFFPQGTLGEKARYIITNIGRSKYDHPTVKPQSIMEKLVLNGSKPSDVILDPFSGSGSTGVAAMRLGRKFIGIEEDQDFYEMSKERLLIASGTGIPDEGDQQSLFNH